MMRQTQSKKIQNTTKISQELFLAKCFVEQRIELSMKRVIISLKRDIDGTVLFQIVQTKQVAAVVKDAKLCVFANPLKKFVALPLEYEMVSLDDIIKTDNVIRCTKCKSWMQDTTVTKCPCGGYLQKRKRFHLKSETTESLDSEYVEIQTALKDAKISRRMDSKPRRKTYVPTGIITPKMAGMSSVSAECSPKMIPRVSEQGAKWLEIFGISPIGEKVIIRKMNGFNIPTNDENIQASLRTSLMNSFSSEVSN